MRFRTAAWIGPPAAQRHRQRGIRKGFLTHPFLRGHANERRKEGAITILKLRRRVSANYEEIATRNIQFHLVRMQMTGVVAAFKMVGGTRPDSSKT